MIQEIDPTQNQTRRSILPLDACAHADDYPIQNA